MPFLLMTAALAETSSLDQSFMSTPFSKTVTSRSSFASPWPSVSVLYDAPSLTSLSCPFLDALPAVGRGEEGLAPPKSCGRAEVAEPRPHHATLRRRRVACAPQAASGATRRAAPGPRASSGGGGGARARGRGRHCFHPRRGALVGDRVLVHVARLAVDDRLAALEGAPWAARGRGRLLISGAEARRCGGNGGPPRCQKDEAH